MVKAIRMGSDKQPSTDIASLCVIRQTVGPEDVRLDETGKPAFRQTLASSTCCVLQRSAIPIRITKPVAF